MNIIFFIILFPLIGFLLLSCKQDCISRNNVSKIGILSVFLSFTITVLYIINFINDPSRIYSQKLWNWVYINNVNINFGLFLDGLSLNMLGIVTGIGLLIHIFSSWYMNLKEGYARFFAYTNLFIASMSILVLADNLLFMYLGWEGVSICSYLLIGFYYTNPHNNSCAFKAFIITRISDIFLMIAIFLIYKEYNTFNFQEIKSLSVLLNPENIDILNFITVFILIGVLGKSAQLPLHTWLSDAMVGPTPVSALIHAATMVTAGVYLIARTYFLFSLTPDILYFISIIGILTIIISSISALVQTDIKRILAYSTMSQIGYMFLGLGVKAWSAVIAHLTMHAIFKALLFLSSGSLIQSCNNQKNIFKMGGLRKSLPFLYMSFLIGGASLISFPLVTSGFYSKGNILFSVLKNGHFNFFLIGLVCSFLTSLYTFRMIFVVFHGHSIHNVTSIKTLSHNIPLLILLVLSTAIGSYLSLPLFSVFPQEHSSMDGKFIFETISGMLSISGVYLAYYFWVKNKKLIDFIFKYTLIQYIHSILLHGWGFDYFYKIVFVKPYISISRLLFYDPFNKITYLFINITRIFNMILLKTSNGYIRWYVASMIIGINVIFVLILFFYFSLK